MVLTVIVQDENTNHIKTKGTNLIFFNIVINFVTWVHGLGSTENNSTLSLPSPGTVTCDPPFLGMAENLPAHGKWWVNSLLCFACLYLLNCFYLNPWVSSLLLLQFSPSLHWRGAGMGKHLCGAQLPAGAEPWQHGESILLFSPGLLVYWSQQQTNSCHFSNSYQTTS